MLHPLRLIFFLHNTLWPGHLAGSGSTSKRSPNGHSNLNAYQCTLNAFSALTWWFVYPHLQLAIVPSAKAYKLEPLMAAVKEYQARTGQRVFMEYVMLAGVNDGLEEAHELGQLLQGMDV